MYEVGHEVEFNYGEFFTIESGLVPNVVLLSSLWGGPDSLYQSSMTLSDETELEKHLNRALDVCSKTKERTQ